MADSTGTTQHAEGIQHIAANTAAPDGEHTSEGGPGTTAGSGGAVSSSAYVGSPVHSGEQQKPQGGIVNTVKSYLGYGGSGGSGGHDSEGATLGEPRADAVGQDSTYLKYRPDEGHQHERGNVNEGSTGTSGLGAGSGAGGVSGAIGSAAEAVGLSGGNRSTEGTTSSSITGQDRIADTSSSGYGSGTGSAAEAVGLSGGNRSGEGTTPSSLTGRDTTTNTSSSSAPVSSTVESAKDKLADTPTEGREETSGTDSHKPPEPAPGKRMENPTAIPTAGGERLGEKHWGESKIVPDNPAPRDSDAGVSSSAGQPTKETASNTAANTGGATGGPGSHGNNSHGTGEKPKTMDKIKEKLHIGHKD